MPRRPLLPSAISGPGRSTACASTIRRETGASTCVILPAVAGERGDRSVSLVEQGPNLRAVIDIVGGKLRRNDLPGVGIHAEVELSPGPARFGAMLLDQPFAGPTQAQAGAVHQQVHGFAVAARSWPRHF